MSQHFSGQDLRDRSFANQDLTGADFSHADLRGTDFRNATLVGADLSYARLGLLPFRPGWAIIYATLRLCLLITFFWWVLISRTTSSLMSVNTRFFQANLVFPGVVLFTALCVWFIIKSQPSYRSHKALAAGTMATTGLIVIAGTATLANEALVTSVGAAVICILIGSWISILTLELPIKQQKILKWLGWGIFGILLLGYLNLLQTDFDLAVWIWIPFIGYFATRQAVLSAIVLTLAFDKISSFRRAWALVIVCTFCWWLASVWVINFEAVSLWVLLAMIVVVIVVVSVIAPGIARQVKVGERPFPWMLSLLEVAQGATNFADANLTDAILIGTNVANTNFREAVLTNARIEDEFRLGKTHQRANILNEHPQLPKLLKQPYPNKQFNIVWIFLATILFLGVPNLTSHVGGTRPSPKDAISYLRSSTLLERVFNGPTAYITDLAFSPDSQLLASGAESGTIELQNIKTGQSHYTLTGHSETVDELAISADDQSIVSSGWDGMVKLWDLGTGQLIRNFQEEGAWFSIISANGQTFAIRTDHTITLRELPTGKVLQTLSINSGGGGFILSPDGQYLIELNTNTADVWDVKSGQLLHTLTGNSFSDGLGNIIFSPDGQTLINAYREQEDDWRRQGSLIELWNLTTGQLEETRRVSGWIDAIAISPDGRLLVGAVRPNDVIQVWDLKTGKLLYTLPKVLWAVKHMVISPDGQFLASSSNWGRIEKIAIWRLNSLYREGSKTQ